MFFVEIFEIKLYSLKLSINLIKNIFICCCLRLIYYTDWIFMNYKNFDLTTEGGGE